MSANRVSTLLTLPALLVLSLGDAAGQATGGDGFRQTVVVTAAAAPIPLGTATRALSVVTREQIAAMPAQSVADVLRLIATVDVRARGVRGAQTDFSLRGATFGQVLVLVDGVRLNDAQSGHHNGDIPVPLDDVERIEVLRGAGSALFGADALGGTINIITRQGASSPSLQVHGGSFGLAGGAGQAGIDRGRVSQRLAASAERSSGFMYARDFEDLTVRSRTRFGEAAGVTVAFQRKAFGANGFYGNAPSREWTNQTLVSVDQRLGEHAGWRVSSVVSYRTHGDRFLFNQTTPALFNNLHRTHAVVGSLHAVRPLAGGRVTVGVEGGGDWIRSTNLGNHEMRRASAFGEWRRVLGSRTQLDGAVRVDRYSQFGTSWNPSVGVGWSATPRLRLRASAGRAFRVPTFTERYYSDPNHLARPEVGPETSWSGDGGVDVFLPAGWVLETTLFGRSDADVIDWLRPSTLVRWRTVNVRDVQTRGVELAVRKTLPGGAFLHASYTGLRVDAASVTELSKYVLESTPRALAASALVPLPGGLRVAPRAEYRRRVRAAGAQDYLLLDARVTRALGRGVDLFVEGTNLLDASYQEIAGVAMPGTAMSVSLAIKGR